MVQAAHSYTAMVSQLDGAKRAEAGSPLVEKFASQNETQVNVLWEQP